MQSHHQTQVTKDFKEKSILVSREFDAPLANVWSAHTESELLDQWWAPYPWKVKTQTMNFAVGGYWLYAMISPENEKHWGRMNYTAIEHLKSYEAEDCFCDEAGNIHPELPVSKGTTVFTETNTGTRVEFKLLYSTETDLQKIIDFGFEQGVTTCFEQLNTLFKLHKI